MCSEKSGQSYMEKPIILWKLHGKAKEPMKRMNQSIIFESCKASSVSKFST